MLDRFPISLIVGTVLGVLTGLGIGGGSLLILWLTLAVQLPPETARGINLLFFLPGAAIASWLRRKQGAVDIRRLLPAMIAGSLSAALFSWLCAGWSSDSLRKGFGVLLLITGWKEIKYKEKKASSEK